MRAQFSVVVLLVLCLLIPVFGSATTLPTGFAETQIVSGIASPTAMDFSPDGRLFVCEQGGNLRVIKNGSLLATPFLTVSVNSSGERGLLGVTFDPNFATNRFVYVYYTTFTTPIHNRLSRFTADAANPDRAQAGSEQILMEFENLSATNHNGGAIHFGLDGKLYIAVGENAVGSNAQALTNKLGKVLRINADGSIPTDNPFFSQTTGDNRAIWARGLRNPFTFAFQPGTGRMFINDVGQNTWEEINDGLAGANYGWPSSEGFTNCSPNFTCPLLAYGHGTGPTTGCAITGAAFYNPATNTFPPDYIGDYFYADFCSNWIRKYDPGTNTAAAFATSTTSNVVDLKVHTDGALYYLARGGSGSVFRIQYTANQAPTITTHPTDKTISAGQSATFTVVASGTPPLSYQWQRNNVDISGATAASFTLNNAQLTDDGDLFRCVVTNSFGFVNSNQALLTVTPNNSPTGTIDTPAEGTFYSGGQTINYSGTGTDPEDVTVPASRFTWRVDLHHDTHSHPHVPPTTGSTSGSFLIPTVGETSDNQWYRIHLTVQDSGGLTHSTFRDVLPRKSTVTLASNPTGLQLTLDGQPVTAPFAFVGVEGMTRTIEAVSPQTPGGTTYTFVSWSDGGAVIHDISTPVSDTTYTATFTSGGGCSNETANQTTALISAKDNTVNSTITPAFTISGADATTANISWLLGGNTDLTSCVAIHLRAPNSSQAVLKAIGAPNSGSADVTTFYKTNGQGTYTILVQELSNCGGSGNRKADLSQTQMIVTDSVGCGCTPPSGLSNNAAADLNACTDTGVLVSWNADPASWGDGGSGTRTYDVLRDGVAIASGLAHGTTSFNDNTAVDGVSHIYSVRYRNGCGSTSATAGTAAADQSGATPQTETANQNALTEAKNNTVTTALAPAFTISSVDATAASVSWTLAGNTDLTNCVSIQLRSADGSQTTLKAAGSPNPGSANVLGFYIAEGPGTYTIVFTENASCGAGNRKAQLSGTQMTVQKPSSCN